MGIEAGPLPLWDCLVHLMFTFRCLSRPGGVQGLHPLCRGDTGPAALHPGGYARGWALCLLDTRAPASLPGEEAGYMLAHWPPSTPLHARLPTLPANKPPSCRPLLRTARGGGV